MLAELHLLLHEVGDSLRGRPPHPGGRRSAPLDTSHTIEVLVTGVASAGKSRLIAALTERLPARGLVVRAAGADPPSPDEHRVHVHAESDLDALVEGRVAARLAARHAALVVPVDWEPVARSVARIVEHLRARGLDLDA